MYRHTFRFFIFSFCFLLFSTPTLAFTSLFGGPESVTLQNDQVTLSAEKLKPGESKHFVYKNDGMAVRFFLVRDKQGVVRAALDACEVCWHADKGYTLRDGAMLCVNCGQSFALNRIGQVRGGCNPHPLEFVLDKDSVTIQRSALAEGVRYFPKNLAGGAR